MDINKLKMMKKLLLLLLTGLCGLQTVSYAAETTKEKRGKRGLMMTNPIGKMPEKAPQKTPEVDTQSFKPPKESVLPPLSESDKKKNSLADQQQVMIKTIVVTGKPIFSEITIQELTAPYTKRVVTLSEIFELRDKLTLLYINKGYATSGVVLKDQDVTDGNLVFEVVEGNLPEVTIHGNQNLDADFISSRVLHGLTTPLNVNDLEERMQLLRQREMILNVKSELKPGLKKGDALLNVDVEEASPYFGGASLHNHSSPNIGANKMDFHVGVRSLLGKEDKITVGYEKSSGANNYSASYDIPVNVHDTTLKIALSRTINSIIVAPFNYLNVQERSKNYSMNLRHPFIKNPGQELAGTVGIQLRSSRSFLLGEPFDFTTGTQDGRSKLAMINLGQEWIMRDASQVVSLHSLFSKGVNCCGAKVLPGEPNGEFLAWLGQAQWVRAMPILDSQVIAKGVLRLTNKSMLSTEKFSLGGADTVRGYRENLLSRDQGELISLEWRVPTTLSLPIPITSSMSSYGGLTGAVFYDYGRAKAKGGIAPAPEDISSIGVGLLWSISKHSNVDIYAADRLRNIPDFSKKDLQDHGIHFRLNIATD